MPWICLFWICLVLVNDFDLVEYDTLKCEFSASVLEILCTIL